MRTERRVRGAVLSLVLLFALGVATLAGCGKKAPPVPPRETPSQVEQKG